MKISELVQQLGKIKKMHGDLACSVSYIEDGYCDESEVRFVLVEDDDGAILNLLLADQNTADAFS